MDISLLFFIQVPWSRLGQEPVLVYLDRILLLAEPATQIEGCSEDAVQEAKKNQVKVKISLSSSFLSTMSVKFHMIF